MAKDKITKKQVAALKWIMQKNFTAREWAEVLDVSETAIKNIKSDKSYRAVKAKMPSKFLEEAIETFSLNDVLNKLIKYHGLSEVKDAIAKK